MKAKDAGRLVGEWNASGAGVLVPLAGAAKRARAGRAGLRHSVDVVQTAGHSAQRNSSDIVELIALEKDRRPNTDVERVPLDVLEQVVVRMNERIVATGAAALGSTA